MSASFHPLKIAVLIPAGGIGSRFKTNDISPKQYIKLMGSQSVIAQAIEPFLALPGLCKIIAAIHPQHFDLFDAAVIKYFNDSRISYCWGGETRSESVRNALLSLELEPDLVFIHDAARPFAEFALLLNLINTIQNSEYMGVFPAIPILEAIKRIQNGCIENIQRENLFRAQTPQLFKFNALKDCFARSDLDDIKNAPDEIALFEKCGYPISHVLGCERNIKITTGNESMFLV